jgi:hypothetical protein
MVCTTRRGGIPVLHATRRKKLYKEAEKSGKKKDNLRDDFRRRLANKKKPRRFVERMNFEEIK